MSNRLSRSLPTLRRSSRFGKALRASSILAVGWISSCSPTPGTAPQVQTRRPQTPAILPDFLADPLEPVNRGVWGVNRGLLLGVIEPTGRVYRTVVPRPVRTSINHFSHNVLYPGRLHEVKQALSGCRLMSFDVIPDAGHWVMYERAQAFNALVLQTLQSPLPA